MPGECADTAPAACCWREKIFWFGNYCQTDGWRMFVLNIKQVSWKLDPWLYLACRRCCLTRSITLPGPSLACSRTSPSTDVHPYPSYLGPSLQADSRRPPQYICKAPPRTSLQKMGRLWIAMNLCATPLLIFLLTSLDCGRVPWWCGFGLGVDPQ